MWGLLFGSALLFVPVVGPVMMAGSIVAGLEGALIGGGVAALGGALTSIGVPENSVVEYETALKAGSFLVIAHGSSDEVRRAREILGETGATRMDAFSAPPQTSVGID